MPEKGREEERDRAGPKCRTWARYLMEMVLLYVVAITCKIWRADVGVPEKDPEEDRDS